MRIPDARSNPSFAARRTIIGGIVATELVFISQLSSAPSLGNFQTIGLWLFAATLPWLVIRLGFLVSDCTIEALAVNQSEWLKNIDAITEVAAAGGIALMVAQFNPWMGALAFVAALVGYGLTAHVAQQGAND
jgi:hypothetical protein